MWCGKCQADVAAEVSPDNQRVFCVVCGNLLSNVEPPPRPIASVASDKTKDARELLQRWSSGQSLDPFGPLLKTTDKPARPLPVLEPPAILAQSSNDETLATSSSSPIAQSFASNSATTAVTANNQPVSDVTATTSAIRGEAELVPASAQVQETPPIAMVPITLVATTSVNAPAAGSSPASRADVAGSVTEVAALANPDLLPIHNPLAEPAREAAPVVIPANPFVATDAAPKRSAPVRRIDAAHPREHFLGGSEPSRPTAAPSTPTEPRRSKESRWPLAWLPTWDPAVWRSDPTPSPTWATTSGQLLSYLGVLGLTAGACLIVWSNFGGPANYAATGWLIATAGQMTLLFGIVTLVSGGLEQTTDQVNRRIEQLGDHIIRIEQAAREMNLRGSVPPAHFDRDPSSVASRRDERAVVEE